MRTFCAMLLSAAITSPSFAYTQEQVSACAPDVMRLCADAIPDQSRITKCMIQKKRQISAACMTVFNKGPASSQVAEK